MKSVWERMDLMCQKCGHLNLHESTYCEECGNKLVGIVDKGLNKKQLTIFGISSFLISAFVALFINASWGLTLFILSVLGIFYFYYYRFLGKSMKKGWKI